MVAKKTKTEVKKPKETKKPEPVKEPPKPVNTWFLVRLETLTPVINEYRIAAETPEQAAEIARKGKTPPCKPPTVFALKGKIIKTTVSEYFTRVLKLVK